MAMRSISRFSRHAKCIFKAKATFTPCRHIATNRPLRTTKYAERPVKYEVVFGAYSQAPHGKDICEDAYFIWNSKNIAAFGVADGVSSWRYEGTDPSLFPKLLMTQCEKYLEESQGKICPPHLLSVAYDQILHENKVDAGSCTVCLGILDKQSRNLQTLNLGDSGFCIYRSGQILYKSKEQYHDLNVPFQIGVKEIVDGKSIPHGNSPSDAVVHSFDVEENDLIIFGTDGLFDNMFADNIFAVAYPDSRRDSNGCNDRARELVNEAHERSVQMKPGRTTPREERMREYEDPLIIPGGNVDDVTAVVVHVTTAPC